MSREEAERRGARNVAEALSSEGTAQVNPQAYGYLGGPSGVRIQGLDGDRILVLEDGEPVFGDVGGVIDLSQLSLADVERIELVQGPMSSLYGTNAIGGVINVVSGPPRNPGPSLRFREEVRSRGELFAESTVAHREAENWQALDASFQGRQGVPHPDEPDLLVPEARLFSLGIRTGLEPAGWLKLRFKTRWMHDESEGFRTRDVAARYFIDRRDRADRFTAQAQSTMELSRLTTLDVSLRKTWYATRSDEFYRGSPVGIARQRQLEDQSVEGVVTIADGARRTWVLGTRHELQRFEQSALDTRARASSFVTEHIAEVDPTWMYTGAFYAQLGWRVFDGLTLMPGARAEVHDEYDDVVAPRLALAAELSEAITLRAAFGRGFRVPSPRERGFEFDHSVYGYEVIGNPRLQPERSWGATADATARTRRVRLRVAGFANWIADLIDLDQAPTGAVDVYQYENIGRARTAGGDASLRVNFDEAFTATAGYSFLWTRDDTTGEALPHRAPHTLTLMSDARLPFGLELSVQYKLVSGSHGFEDDDGDDWSRGFSLLGARAAISLWPSLTAYLGVQNLANVRRDPEDGNDLRPAVGRAVYFGFKGQVPGDEP